MLNKIEEDPKNISLLKYIYFRLIDYSSLIQITLMQFSEITNKIFEHFKQVFYSTFLNFKEEFIQQFLSILTLIKNFDIVEHNYFGLYDLFYISINPFL
jgi:hypothetical protein